MRSPGHPIVAAASACLALAIGPGAGAPAAADPPVEEMREPRALLREDPARADSLATVRAGALTLTTRADSLQLAELLDVRVEARLARRLAREPETETLARRGVDLLVALHGERSEEVAHALERLGFILAATEHNLESIDALSRALVIYGEVQGADNERLAPALERLANVHLSGGDHASAEPLVERAIAIREAAEVPDVVELVRDVRALARCRRLDGDLASCRAHCERALALSDSLLGPDHPESANAAELLGVTIMDQGALEEASPYLERTVEIRKRHFGARHPRVADALRQLASQRFYLGELDEAQTIMEEALDIQKEHYGLENTRVASTLNNLGNIYAVRRDFERARLAHEQALEVRERALGPDSPWVAESLTSLAALSSSLKDPWTARPMLERALAIDEAMFGPDHQYVARVLSALAGVQGELGDYDAALRSQSRVLAINEQTLGPDHFDVGASLISYASLQRDAGEAPEVFVPILERGLDILAASTTPGHWLAAQAHHHLASGYLAQGHIDMAEKELALARETTLETFGASSPEFADLLLVDGELALTRGDRATALERALEAERLSRTHRRATIRSLPERVALSSLAAFRSGLPLALSALGEAPRNDDTRRVWTALIRSRALVLDEMASRRASLHDRPETAASRDSLLVATTAYARAVVGYGGAAASPDELSHAREAVEAAERALAEVSEEFRARRTDDSLSLADVTAALPEDAALVAYVRAGTPSRSGSAEDTASDGAPSYRALLLAPSTRAPRAVTLGPAAEIDAAVAAWRAALTGDDRRTGTGEADVRRLGRVVRAALWDPLRALLGEARLVFVVPDGALHLVNLYALPLDDDRYLVETGPIVHTLTSEKDLVDPRRTGGASGRGLLALGGAAFDSLATDLESSVPLVAAGGPGAQPTMFRGARARCVDFRALEFGPLPGSAREAARVAQIWRETTGEEETQAVGARASEALLKRRAPGQRVLHVATHGFFLDPACRTAGAPPEPPLDARGIGALRPSRADSVTRADESPDGAQEISNPLRIAGLALAGANLRESAGPDGEDGVVTAEEMAAMDLRGVEWAVLSACETGVGEVLGSGEGVMGLRRALRVAGVHSVILSLWAVSDAATLEWMDALYRARFADAESTAEAVRSASRALLARRRASGASTHPFYWAAFVAAGDWR